MTPASAEGGIKHARQLVGEAWQVRCKALRWSDEVPIAPAMAKVEAHLRTACEIYERAGARKEPGARAALSAAMGKLGHVALDLDDPDSALTWFEGSVAIAREARDPLRLAHAARHLGYVHHRLGMLESAGRCYEEALDLYDRDGTAHPLDHANALRPMALLQEDLGGARRARVMWRRAMELYRVAGVEEGVAECEARLSGLAGAAGRIGGAR